MRFRELCESYVNPPVDMPIELVYRRKAGQSIQKRRFEFQFQKKDFYHRLPDDATIYVDGEPARKGDLEGRYRDDGPVTEERHSWALSSDGERHPLYVNPTVEEMDVVRGNGMGIRIVVARRREPDYRAYVANGSMLHDDIKRAAGISDSDVLAELMYDEDWKTGDGTLYFGMEPVRNARGIAWLRDPNSLRKLVRRLHLPESTRIDAEYE